MPNTQLPLDYQTEKDQLTQRQALAQAMMQRALTPVQGQMVGGNYASPGAAASIGAPIIQALLTAHMMKQNKATADDMATRYKGIENRLSPKDILSVPGASLDSRRQAALAQDPSLLTPDTRDHVVDGQLVAYTPGTKPEAVGDFRPKMSPVKTVGTNPDGTPIQAQVVEGTNENKYTPSGGVRVNVDTTQKAGDRFATGLADQRAQILGKSYENARAAAKAYDAIFEARQDLANGIKSGTSAHVDLALSKLGQVFGMKADPSVVNTESFRSNMARETLNLVKNLGAGTGISNADRDFAEKAAGGDIMMDNASMVRLANIAIAASGNVLAEHERLLKANIGATGALPEDLATFKVPWQIPVSKVPGEVNAETNPDGTLRFFTNPAGSGGVGKPAGGPRKPSVSNW